MVCRRRRSMSPWTQTKTITNHKTNWERLQTLSLHPVPVLPLQSGSTSSSHGPSTRTSSKDEFADNDHEHGEENLAQQYKVHEVVTTVLHPDLHVLTNVEHWTMTPEAHKHAAAAKSFCFVTTENGEQTDICNYRVCSDHCASMELIDDSSSTQVDIPRRI